MIDTMRSLPEHLRKTVTWDQGIEMANHVAIAEAIAANPPHAVRLAKRLMREALHTRLDTLLEMSAAYQVLAHQSADHQEAVAAFIEKRTPVFTG